MAEKKKNPFTVGFGKLPTQYIGRDVLIDEVLDELDNEEGQSHCFILQGTRGSGKTVTMTAIEDRLISRNDWIVVRLNPAKDILQGLAERLYDSRKYLSSFIDKNLNLSRFGIGNCHSSISASASIESALEKILEEIRRKKKKLLVSIDEVSDTQYLREFISAFQILLRQDLPIHLLLAGLLENVHALESVENLTFLFRAHHFDMKALNIELIADNYRQVLALPADYALEMARLTKGYPFAYQALGKYLWDNEQHHADVRVMANYDECLSHYVYEKLWSELSRKDKYFLSIIVQKESMSTTELLQLSGEKKNAFSQYRARLRDKGLINTSERGMLSCPLPRLKEFAERKSEHI